MAQMRRQSLVKFDAPLCETIVDTPKPKGAEVLLRVERCGLCHSDLHIQDGYADIGGGKKLELVAPTTPGEGGVGRYIEKQGQGFHHLSISVDDLQEAIEYFRSHGIRVLADSFENPQWKHCYLHPQDTFGALIQVFEENPDTLSHGD